MAQSLSNGSLKSKDASSNPACDGCFFFFFFLSKLDIMQVMYFFLFFSFFFSLRSSIVVINYLIFKYIALALIPFSYSRVRS